MAETHSPWVAGGSGQGGAPGGMQLGGMGPLQGGVGAVQASQALVNSTCTV